MNNQRMDFLAGFLLAGILVGAFSCAGNAAREEVLLPTMAATYASIRGDIARGLEDETEAVRLEVSALADSLGAALSAGDRDGAQAVGFLGLRPWAEAGVVARAAAGEISRGVMASLMERINQFAAAIERL